MRWITLLFIVLILFSSACSKQRGTTSDESVSGIKGKVPQTNENYQEITIECEDLRLASMEELEAMGYSVEGNIAKNYQGEFDITKKKFCFDSPSSRCRAKCSEIGGKLNAVRIDENITCSCFIG